MRLLAYILTICIFLQCTVQLGIGAWYLSHKASITAQFCENKDKPQLKCQGKCHLRKQMKQTEEGQGKQGSTSNHKAEWVALMPQSPANDLPVHYASENIKPGDSYQNPTGFEPVSSIFHPPPFAACLA